MTVTIKPHHLLDVYKLYGKGIYPFSPDMNYEHDFYLIGNLLLNGKVDMVSLTTNSDDMCKPCKFNKTGICNDELLIDSFDKKDSYNRFIDKNLLSQLQLEEDKIYDFQKLLSLIAEKLSFELICHTWRFNTDDDNRQRFMNTLSGIKKYIQCRS